MMIGRVCGTYRGEQNVYRVSVVDLHDRDNWEDIGIDCKILK
jgi:hypothetical protein